MKVVVLGTGFVGAELVKELARRGHQIVAVSRNPGRTYPAGVTEASGSVYDAGFVSEITAGADVVAVALPPVSDDGGIAAAVTALLRAIDTRARLGVVGGSAVLPLREGGPRLGDTDRFPVFLRNRVDVHQAALDLLNTAPAEVDWFELIPAEEFGPHAPGTRTGQYRTSRTALVADTNGRSAIGVEDYAIAFADELERPTTHRSWLTAGY